MGKFLKPGSPLLRDLAEEISPDQINSPEVKKITKLMFKIITGEQKKNGKGVGLAAPQIGILKRIILVDVAADGKGKVGDLKIFINPEIIWVSKRKKEWYEGCYSTGMVCGIVSRPILIKVKAFTENGSPWEDKVRGYVARIFQHEIDHLNGQVFISHIKDPSKLHKVSKKEFPLYRKSWRRWPNKYPLPLAYGKLKKV